MSLVPAPTSMNPNRVYDPTTGNYYQDAATAQPFPNSGFFVNQPSYAPPPGTPGYAASVDFTMRPELGGMSPATQFQQAILGGLPAQGLNLSGIPLGGPSIQGQPGGGYLPTNPRDQLGALFSLLGNLGGGGASPAQAPAQLPTQPPMQSSPMQSLFGSNVYNPFTTKPAVNPSVDPMIARPTISRPEGTMGGKSMATPPFNPLSARPTITRPGSGALGSFFGRFR